MKNNLVILSFILFASCVQSQTISTVIPVGKPGKPTSNEAVAYFAEGCFWHAEIVFQSLKGVRDAVSGYAGGTMKNPDYETVCSGSTGHAETVQVIYDPKVISYQTLVRAFFASVDPTTLNRQGNDAGTQYRSAIFYSNDKEKQVAFAEINRLTASKKYNSKIVTEVKPITQFYPAEEYHQEYIKNHPGNSYVEHVSIPDYLEFRKEFNGPYKQ